MSSTMRGCSSVEGRAVKFCSTAVEKAGDHRRGDDRASNRRRSASSDDADYELAEHHLPDVRAQRVVSADQ
jgi:hypothetical protein